MPNIIQNLKFKILSELVHSFSKILSEEWRLWNARDCLEHGLVRAGALRWLDKARQSRANTKSSLGILYVSKADIPSKGFTLIETIIALAVITSAVVGPFSLATRGILNSSFAKNKIVAANLAQEGIELVREIRENNILAGRGWDYGIASGSWQVDIFSSDLSPFSGVPLLFDSATGIYSQASGSQTNFIRRITITKPSANEISISSEVSWMERSIDRKIILSEKFYNWR